MTLVERLKAIAQAEDIAHSTLDETYVEYVQERVNTPADKSYNGYAITLYISNRSKKVVSMNVKHAKLDRSGPHHRDRNGQSSVIWPIFYDGK